MTNAHKANTHDLSSFHAYTGPTAHKHSHPTHNAPVSAMRERGHVPGRRQHGEPGIPARAVWLQWRAVPLHHCMRERCRIERGEAKEAEALAACCSKATLPPRVRLLFEMERALAAAASPPKPKRAGDGLWKC